VTAVAYLAGSVLGGLAAGAVLGSVGALVVWSAGRLWPHGAFAVGLAAAIVLMASALDASRLSVPGPRRQVNEDWLVRYRGGIYGIAFGFQLGIGVVTYVPTAALYAAWVLALLTGSFGAGAVVGATFGLARALPILGAARVGTPARLRAFHVRMHGLAPVARWGTVAALGAIGAIGVAAAVVA
jgi:hypothetical protein